MTRVFHRVKQDDEMPFYNRGIDPTKGWPMVFRLEPYTGTKLLAPLQWFWFNLNLTSSFIESVKAWQAYTKDGVAFNNGLWGVNFGRDYVSGLRLKSPLIPKMGTLICGGNVICGSEMTLTKRAGNIAKGTRVLKVETINVNRGLPVGITYASHPWLIHHATIIRPEIEANGLKMVNPFPQMGGRDGRPIYYPVWSAADVYYPLRMLEKVAVVPNPYNPAW